MAFSRIPTGNRSPELVNAVVEIPKGSRNKYEYDEKLDEIRLDRILRSPLYYPADYGFIPQTRSEDGDPLDVLVIISESVFSGCVLSVRPIGVLDMHDDGSQDWKIITVAQGDPHQAKIQSLDDLDDLYKNEIRHFFEQYKKLEQKVVVVDGWLGIDVAHRLITEAQSRYSAER
jgi:inorganic pyrophosphatase